jgi:H+/Cl- antiporter ClcA
MSNAKVVVSTPVVDTSASTQVSTPVVTPESAQAQPSMTVNTSSRYTSGAYSPLGVSGIIMIVIGLIVALVGIIILVINQNKPKEWYMWLLAIVGLIAAIIGAILLAYALNRNSYAWMNSVGLSSVGLNSNCNVCPPSVKTIETKVIEKVPCPTPSPCAVKKCPY